MKAWQLACFVSIILSFNVVSAGEESVSTTAGEAAGNESQEVSLALLAGPGKGRMVREGERNRRRMERREVSRKTVSVRGIT